MMDLGQLRPQVNSILWYKRRIAELEAQLEERTEAATSLARSLAKADMYLAKLVQRVEGLEAKCAD